MLDYLQAIQIKSIVELHKLQRSFYMATELNETELDILLKADEELFNNEYTNQKCPRCGNKIICEEIGKSYTIKCETPDCISTSFRGI